MRNLIFLLSFSFLLYGNDFLKVVFLDKGKNFVKEWNQGDGFELSKVYFKEGFLIFYPDGSPPLIYKIKGEDLEKIFEEKNLRSFPFSAYDCENYEKVRGFFKIFPLKVEEDFPLKKEYYFILLKDKENVNLKEGDYVIEEIEGRYLNKRILNFKGEILFYPSFKSKITIEDPLGFPFENCKSIWELNYIEYGKRCLNFKEIYHIEGSNYNFTFPKRGTYLLRIFCEGAKGYSKKGSNQELKADEIFTLKRLGEIEGFLKEKSGKVVQGYDLSLFYEDNLLPLQRIKTDQKGYFKFSNLEEGNYFIKDSSDLIGEEKRTIILKTKNETSAKLVSEDFAIYSMPEPRPNYVMKEVYLKVGERVSLNLEIPNLRVWEGKVISKNGKPISGASFNCNGREIGKTNERGDFKIEYRGQKIDEVWVFAEGYTSLKLEDISLENPLSPIVLSSLGRFKVSFYLKDYANFGPKLFESIKFLKENGEFFKPEGRFSLRGEELIYDTELEEGYYRFSVQGVFKEYFSEKFLILADREYDYGIVTLEPLEEIEEERFLEIYFKDRDDRAISELNVSFIITSLEDSITISAMSLTDEEGKILFELPFKKHKISFLYAEGEEGFLIMDEGELLPYGNLNNLVFKLNPPNKLILKISSLEPKLDFYDIELRSKFMIIKERVPYLEEKEFKNLTSPINLKVFYGNKVIWEETIEIVEGKNELNL